MKKVGNKVSIRVIIFMVIAVGTVLGIMYFGASQIIANLIRDRGSQGLGVLTSTIENYKQLSNQAAVGIAADRAVAEGVEKGDKAAIIAAAKAASSQFATMDFITILDTSGTVLARVHSDKAGDSLAYQDNVAKAMGGETGTYIEQGTEILLSLRTSTPIYSANGNRIGIISTGYELDDPRFIDDLKEISKCEYTVFLGDESINTTITRDGERQVGTKLDASIADIVIGEGNTYDGEADIQGVRHYTIYEPILDADNEVIGIFFVGIETQTMWTTIIQTLLVTVGISIAVVIISIVVISLTIKKIVSKPLGLMSEATSQLSQGNLNISLNYKSNDEIGLLSDNLKLTIQTLKLYINDISEHLISIANGDLTSEFTQSYAGDFVSIEQSLAAISSGLNESMGAIITSADQVNAGAEQVSAGAQALSQGATEQASAIEELTSSIFEVSDKVTATANNVSEATDIIRESGEGVEKSNEHMRAMLVAMDEINKSSQEIGNIIKVIDDIAFQTNILALNAAVEAARAGAAGKGFAVVADEVRNLASKSAEAAKQTTTLIEDSTKSVDKGAKIAKATAEALEQVREKTEKVSEVIENIKEASDDQARAIEQISSGIEQIATVVHTNSATAEESAASSEELSGQAQMLKQETGKFTVK
ncbi:MAG TPA: methyl-accepting chemotaxis protein [Oscillospiraceae bacterium]|nr:methyl-accepting chemotaxis protein [Oscillospiraceae bacterium]